MKHAPTPHPAEIVSEAPAIDPLFTTLGALTQREEEQVSRTFQACFNHSKAFQEIVFQVVATHCKLPFKINANAGWYCDVEVPTNDGKGRIDIRLRPIGDSGQRRTICIESKVKAPDKKEQLQRYIDQKMGTVVLLTKQRPKIGERELKAQRVRHFRWQDLHHALSNGNGIKGKDKFLVGEFCHYLEGLGMASESKVSKEDLQEIARVFKVIGSPDTDVGVQLRRGLDAASRWMNLLSELAVRLKEQKRLAGARQWGPKYTSWEEAEEAPKVQNLAISFMPPSKRFPEFSISLYIYANKSYQVGVIYNDGDANWEEIEWKALLIPSIMRRGYVDLDVLTKKVLDLAEQWKVRLQ